ncbi:MAG: acylphosphatase [Gammaproteobacteria bacterium]|nr:acylphosphatase [Gammaproteobacteria bacterium]
MHSVRGFVSGRVQGVGFRYFVRSLAQQHRLRGYAHNLSDGRVEFLLQGEPAAVEQVIAGIRTGPSHARVDAVRLEEAQDQPALDGFGTR